MSYYGRRRQYEPEESIYDLIPRQVPEAKKQPRYKSKYPHDTPPTCSTFGRSRATAVLPTNVGGDYVSTTRNHNWKSMGATFGKKSDHYADPSNFLKKNTKESLPQAQKFSYKNKLKPPVVKATDKPKLKRRAQTNYIKENALNVIMAAPGKKKDDKINYLEKDDYGRVPAYLEDVKREVQEEREYIAQCIEAERSMYQPQQQQMKLMEESERLELLNNLKKKWEIVNKDYQNMTHLVTLDTAGKVRRKEDYESNLSRLERAIEKISKPYVFIEEVEEY